MKFSLFILILSGYCITANAQAKKISIGLEYSPSFSNVTTEFSSREGYRQSHNVFLKGGYALSEKLELTLAAGYLNTRQFDRFHIPGLQEIESIESLRNHNYAVFPVGIRYKFGSFYVNPEIGIGIDIGHPTRQVTYFNDGSIINSHFDANPDVFGYKKFSVPLMLSIGNEIDFHGMKILLGAKAYYSLSTLRTSQFEPQHYFGIGIVTGIRF